MNNTLKSERVDQHLICKSKITREMSEKVGKTKKEKPSSSSNLTKKCEVSLPNKDHVMQHFYIGLEFFTCLNINKVE